MANKTLASSPLPPSTPRLLSTPPLPCSCLPSPSSGSSLFTSFSPSPSCGLTTSQSHDHMCCPTVSYHEQGVFIVSWYLPIGYDTHLICPQVAVVFIVQPFLQVSYSIGGGHILPSVYFSKEVLDMNFRHYIIQSEKIILS